MKKTMLLITERTNDIPEWALLNYHGSTETCHTVSHYGSRQRVALRKKHGTPLQVDLSHTFAMFGMRFICEEYRPIYKAQLEQETQSKTEPPYHVSIYRHGDGETVTVGDIHANNPEDLQSKIEAWAEAQGLTFVSEDTFKDAHGHICTIK